jgi:hypothetical protein
MEGHLTMAKSTTGIPLLSIKAAGRRRLGGIGSAGGRALRRIKPASMPGLTGHTGGKFGVKPAAVTNREGGEGTANAGSSDCRCHKRQSQQFLGRTPMISDKLGSIGRKLDDYRALQRRRRVRLASFLLATDVSVGYVVGLLVHHLFLIH